MRSWLPSDGLGDRIRDWLRRRPRIETEAAPVRTRGRVDHVVILDGTMSSLDEGYETNAGLTYKLLTEAGGGAHLSLRYEAGVQWEGWHNTLDVIEGRGINRQIRRSYGFLASRWRPGDRIWLFGYSRGAYAVRSLAGVIDRMGLLTPDNATERNIRTAYRHYQTDPDTAAARAFRAVHCHPEVEIELVGVWDTVKALGLRAPLLWRWSDVQHRFHSPHLGRAVRRGYHALALDERREAFTPVLWQTPADWPGQIEQVWFRGTHGDVGGMLDGMEAARPLSNIPLVWMLERAEAVGLPLPVGWRGRFPEDPFAPSIGTWRGWGKFFLARRRRRVGMDASERIHPSALLWKESRRHGRRVEFAEIGTGLLHPDHAGAGPPATGESDGERSRAPVAGGR